MPLVKSNGDIAPRLEEYYPSGKFWMQPSLSMPKSRGLKLRSEPAALSFTTIDDAIQLTQELLARLNKLGEYKHPLSVRKGVSRLELQEESRVVKAGSKTYFFDIKQTKDGQSYLVITESRFKKEGEARERAALIVFPDHIQEFVAAIEEMAKRLGEA